MKRLGLAGQEKTDYSTIALARLAQSLAMKKGTLKGTLFEYTEKETNYIASFPKVQNNILQSFSVFFRGLS